MRMTIHQALSTLKMLEKRIASATRQTFITSKKKSADKIDGINIKEVNETLTGNLQKVNQLIENRKALRSAVVLSNAATQITIGDKTYTVAEAIERKANVASEQALLVQMQSQYQKTTQQVNQENANLQNRLESYLMSVLGKENRKPDDVKQYSEEFFARNELELIDPNKIAEAVKELEKSILDFLNEVDYKLSESNSTTFIDVEYQNV
jgi:hypothetical protein